MPPRVRDYPDVDPDMNRPSEEDTIGYAGMAPPLGLHDDPWAAELKGSPSVADAEISGAALPTQDRLRRTSPRLATATTNAPIRVYVAGPYTKPDPCVNTYEAIRAADDLLDRGFVPFVPHLTSLWNTVSPKDYAVWMGWCLAWVEVCHAVLRLPGESAGADAEVRRARELGIPVFHEVETMARRLLG